VLKGLKYPGSGAHPHSSSRGLLSLTFNVPPCESDLDLVRTFRETLPKTCKTALKVLRKKAE